MDDVEKLKAENEELTRAVEGKSDLISLSAHKLRTSLTALKWILTMFRDDDLGPITQEQRGFIEKGLESNERMIALVSDLLTLNHTDTGALAPLLAPVDIAALLEQTILEFYGETHKKKIELAFAKPEGGFPHAICDRETMRVVFENLIENAIKYSAEGTTVAISLAHDASAATVSVHDMGIGIPLEDQDKIFTKFFRAPNAVEKNSVGSGLGLFTVRGIIERNKGTIRFESAEGGGTTFFVSLPVA